MAKRKNERASSPSSTSVSDVASTAPDQYNDLVQRFRAFSERSGEGIIRAAETLAKAEQELAPRKFTSFCDDIGIPQNSSNCKKLTIIGQKASRFEPFMGRLPNTWTTLYLLARLSDEDFDRVVKSNALLPFMTADEVTRVLRPEREPKEKQPRDLWIRITELSEDKKLEFYNRLLTLQEACSFELHLTGEFKKLVGAEHS